MGLISAPTTYVPDIKKNCKLIIVFGSSGLNQLKIMELVYKEVKLNWTDYQALWYFTADEVA